ncbi:MAG: hypothetical protein A2Z70_04435 [Chloroflexi bacterium RBG_13_48_17]|nr:MAG: hypothetical protein A2Z70_04435 [Chloroflexi bacterium RBG_13_48_17]
MWVIVVLVSLAVLITLFLCIPLDLVFRANVEGRPKFSLRLKWFFGLVSSELRQTRKKPEEKKVEYEGKPGDWLSRLRVAFEILQTKGLLKQLRSFIKRTIRRIKIRELTANLKVGLDNPADTGLLFAFIAPLSLAINYFLPHPIKIQPSFTGESFITGYLYGEVRLWPIQLAASLIAFAFSLPTLRAAKKLVLYKWRRR